jgi:hypothetical protein
LFKDSHLCVPFKFYRDGCVAWTFLLA